MGDLILTYETEGVLPFPRLKAAAGATRAFGAGELAEIERALRPRYDGLVQHGGGVLEHRGRTFRV